MLICLEVLLRSVGPSMLRSVGLSSISRDGRLSDKTSASEISYGSDLTASWGVMLAVGDLVSVGDICCLRSEMFLMFLSSVGFLKNLKRITKRRYKI